MVSPPIDGSCLLGSDQGKHTNDGFLLRAEDTNDKLSVIDDRGGVALAIPCDRLRLPERDCSGELPGKAPHGQGKDKKGNTNPLPC